MSRDAGPTDGERERLRRLLRGQAAVNRELSSRLEAGGEVDKVRRGGVGGEWLDRLQQSGPVEAALVRAPDGSPFVLEGRSRRPVGSELLFDALGQVLGEPSEVSERTWSDTVAGVPVEVLEAQSGYPFVVVGGTRFPIRNLPIPHPVGGAEAEHFPVGESLDVEAVGRQRLVGQLRVMGSRAAGRAREVVSKRRGSQGTSEPGAPRG